MISFENQILRNIRCGPFYDNKLECYLQRKNNEIQQTTKVSKIIFRVKKQKIQRFGRLKGMTRSAKIKAIVEYGPTGKKPAKKIETVVRLQLP